MVVLLIAPMVAFAGFTALCATTRRHVRDIWGKDPPAGKIRLVRAAGWAAVLVAMLPCIAWWSGAHGDHWTPAMGLVAWGCMLSVVVLAVVLTLAFAPRIRSVMVAGAGAGLTGGFLALLWLAGIIRV